MRVQEQALDRDRLRSAVVGATTKLEPVLANLAAPQIDLDKNTLHAATRAGSNRYRHRLVERTTFGWTLLEAATLERLGATPYLERQLHPQDIDDLGLESALRRALPSLTMTPFERLYRYNDERVTPYIELALAKLLRAIYSPVNCSNEWSTSGAPEQKR